MPDIKYNVMKCVNENISQMTQFMQEKATIQLMDKSVIITLKDHPYSLRMLLMWFAEWQDTQEEAYNLVLLYDFSEE